MTRLLTTEIATMTEMREPQKVLDRAKGRPVAVLKNSKLVGYFIPESALPQPDEGEHLTTAQVRQHLERQRDAEDPVGDLLRGR